VHYKQIGVGEPVFILLHGFGASTFSWREVMTPLSDYGMVIAYDRPAFGLTERPMTWEEDNPYTMESNIALLLGLMDAMSVDEAILVGNSAGGTLATAFTLAHPDRVQALIEVNAAIYQTRPDSTLLNWLFQTPQMDHIGPLISRQLAGSQGDAFLESAWYDPSKLEANPEIIAGYRKPLMVEHWDRALWEHTKASSAPGLADSLGQIKAPVLIIAGENDQIVPVENSYQLAEDLQNSTLTVLQNCGHVPQEECPVEFLVAVDNFLIMLLEE
jgi:pimeloyl-ACP methyl ester carboxylesterase